MQPEARASLTRQQRAKSAEPVGPSFAQKQLDSWTPRFPLVKTKPTKEGSRDPKKEEEFLVTLLCVSVALLDLFWVFSSPLRLSFTHSGLLLRQLSEVDVLVEPLHEYSAATRGRDGAPLNRLPRHFFLVLPCLPKA